jgi:hypothetical protein
MNLEVRAPLFDFTNEALGGEHVEAVTDEERKSHVAHLGLRMVAGQPGSATVVAGAGVSSFGRANRPVLE